jgi:hypothetical protein
MGVDGSGCGLEVGMSCALILAQIPFGLSSSAYLGDLERLEANSQTPVTAGMAAVRRRALKDGLGWALTEVAEGNQAAHVIGIGTVMPRYAPAPGGTAEADLFLLSSSATNLGLNCLLQPLMIVAAALGSAAYGPVSCITTACNPEDHRWPALVQLGAKRIGSGNNVLLDATAICRAAQTLKSSLGYREVETRGSRGTARVDTSNLGIFNRPGHVAIVAALGRGNTAFIGGKGVIEIERRVQACAA